MATIEHCFMDRLTPPFIYNWIVQCGIDYEDLEAFKNSEQGYFKRFKQDEDIPFPADAEILNQGKFLPISLCYLTAAQGKEKTIPLNLKIEFPVLRK